MKLTLEDLIENFAFLDDWDDRYRYVIELGQALSPYPDALRDDDHKVKGCVSQVWFNAEVDNAIPADPVLVFEGDSDAHIVRGLVAIMIIALSGRRASEIAEFDIEATVAQLGLDEHLSPQRSNGLRSMIDLMKSIAKTALSN